MTIASTLSTALSGLTVNARAAALIAGNIANATTDGYGRRELQTGIRTVGGQGQGVQVTGVVRVSDRVLLSDRRIADAAVAGQQTRAAFLGALEAAIGTPTDAAGLGGRTTSLETALLSASGRPESEARLAGVLSGAKALTARMNAAAAEVQDARTRADGAIARDVAHLGSTLSRIAEINAQIRTQLGAGHDASALADQRHVLVDSLSEIVPLREVDRGHGQIALVTPAGAVLLDGKPAEFGFSAANLVTADMTLASGGLSGLTFNGRAVAMDAGILSGGRLAANFAVRDELAPDAQVRLDAVARDLIDRFADAGLDGTLAPGAPGLFTDAGAALDPAREAGLSGRITVNAGVDPSQGGALWRLRDGIGALVPGPSGESRLLTALQGALVQTRAPASGGFMPGARTFSTLAADLASGVSTGRLAAEADQSFAAAKAAGLRGQELEMAVDTDQEIQNLLQVEQAYAANAKVVKSVDDMIKLLLGL